MHFSIRVEAEMPATALASRELEAEMKVQTISHSNLLLLLLVVMSSEGCRAVAGIFKAGVWVGIVIAVVVIGVVIAVVRGFGS
jgi:hypothetical protein